MKKLILISLAILFCALPAFGQSTHSVAVSGTASTDAGNSACPTLCSYTILRASSCTGTFAAIGTAPSTTPSFTFNDTTPVVGPSCYTVVFTVNGVPSGDSNTSAITIAPSAPTGVTTKQTS